MYNTNRYQHKGRKGNPAQKVQVAEKALGKHQNIAPTKGLINSLFR